MKIQFYFYRYNYLAFYLMMISVVNIINEHITPNIEVINDYEKLDFSNNIVVMFFGDLKIRDYKNKIILINSEQYLEQYCISNRDKLEFINSKNNFYIWDFCSININKINKNYSNINAYYLPLLYNSYLELYYNQTITKKIDYNNKEIDILFIGTINERRTKILNELKKIYKIKLICIEDKLTNIEILDYIENSKLVVNIFWSEATIFDYYRCSLLLANNILMVSEYPFNVETELEKNLIDFENKMIFAKYDDIINKVKTTLEKSPEEIKILTKKTYEWFKCHDMKDYINNFFAQEFAVL